MKTNWLLPLLFVGCSALKPVTEESTPNTNAPKEESITVTVPPIPPGNIPFLHARKTFNIALLLPFHTSELTSDSLSLSPEEIDPKSVLAIHYYEGVLLALDSLDKRGLKLKVKVYDAPGDSNLTKEILNQAELKDADLIIGPVNNSSLLVAARYGKENEKFVISPLSASADIHDNPFFIFANASLKSHAASLKKYILEKYKSDTIMVFTHDNETENIFANYFNNDSTYLSPVFKRIELRAERDSNNYKITDYLRRAKNNVIIIPSFDEVFVNIITKQLASLSDTFQTTVFGMPTWTEMESLRVDYLQLINAHVTASYWLSKPSSYEKVFGKKYYDRFKSLPSEYSVQGYDLMLFLGSLILRNNDKWSESLGTNLVKELGNSFYIKPVQNGENKIQYLENKYVHILKYSDNTLKKVN